MGTEYGTWLDSEESCVPAAQNGRASGACSLGDYRDLPTAPVSGVALEYGAANEQAPDDFPGSLAVRPW